MDFADKFCQKNHKKYVDVVYGSPKEGTVAARSFNSDKNQPMRMRWLMYPSFGLVDWFSSLRVAFLLFLPLSRSRSSCLYLTET